MRLPFTHEQFLDVFGAYNGALWPLAAILWVLTAAALWLLTSGRPVSRRVAVLLAIHWLMSGAVYHLLYFRVINAAALVFAIAFIVEGVQFLWFGAVRSRISFERGRSPRHMLGLVLALYGLAYPAFAVASGLEWPRLPLFAVPCPTTLVTAGCLLMAPSSQARGLAIIPILWAAIGGSAALTLGVTPDLMLFAAGALLLVHLLTPRVLDPARAA
jgi:hypothetical protein